MKRGEIGIIGDDDPLKDPIPLMTWMMHRHSENIWRVTKVNAWSLEIENLDGSPSPGINRYITACDIRRGTIVVDKEGPSQ